MARREIVEVDAKPADSEMQGNTIYVVRSQVTVPPRLKGGTASVETLIEAHSAQSFSARVLLPQRSGTHRVRGTYLSNKREGPMGAVYDNVAAFRASLR